MFNNDIINIYNNENNNINDVLNGINKVDYNMFYRGIVVDNQDPLNLGRARIRIQALHGSKRGDTNFVETPNLPWANSAIFSGAGNDSGSFLIPNIGDTVFVTFENGSPQLPIYFGGVFYMYGDKDKTISSSNINKNKPYTYSDDDKIKDIKHNTERVIYKSLKGATILVDDYDSEETVRIVDQSGQEVTMENFSESLDRRGTDLGLSEKSKITVTNSQGDKFTVKNGKIYIQSDSLVIESKNIDIPGYNRDFEPEANLLNEINGESVVDYDSLTDSNVITYQKQIDQILGIEQYRASDRNLIYEALDLLSEVLGEYIDKSKQTDFSERIIIEANDLIESFI